MASPGARFGLTVSPRITITFALILSACFLSCSRKSDPVGILSERGYPPSPYFDPTVNPVDSTIGFGYQPLLRITRANPGGNLVTSGGGYYYQLSDSGTGFWLASWDGSRQRKASSDYYLTSSSYYLLGGIWSSDGKSLITGGQNLTSVPWDGDSLDDNARMELSGAAPYSDPRWNSGMTKIAMWAGGQAFIWTASTHQVSNYGEVNWIQPAWAPDGTMLVFHGYANQQSAVMVADTLGTNARVLVRGLEYLANPVWSPDGSRIAFAGRFANGGDLQIWTVKPDGTGLTQITTDGVQGHISWSPSGAEIVYVHYSFFEFKCAGGNFPNGTIWRVNPTTKARHQITFNAGLVCP